jgi:hypothetical protein
MEKGKISGDSQHSEAPPTVNDSWNRRTHKKTRTEAGGSNAKPRERKRRRQSDHRDGWAGTKKNTNLPKNQNWPGGRECPRWEKNLNRLAKLGQKQIHLGSKNRINSLWDRSNPGKKNITALKLLTSTVANQTRAGADWTNNIRTLLRSEHLHHS